jgi:hypothetical protein
VENVYRLENKEEFWETSGNQSVGDDASGGDCVYRIFQSLLLGRKAVRIMQYDLETNLIYAMLSMANSDKRDYWRR